MASDIEEPSYSSPPKRLKLDNSNVLCNRTSGMDDVSFSSSFKLSEQSQNRDVGLSSELKRKTPDGSNTSTNFDPTQNNHHQSQDAGIEDDDDVSSTVSNLSELSGLSDISGQEWKPIAGPMSWVQKQMLNGVNPRTLLSQMMGDPSHVPTQVDDLTLWKVLQSIFQMDNTRKSLPESSWLPTFPKQLDISFRKNKIIVSMLSEPPRRQRLRHINSLNDVVHLLNTCSRIIVLTGAGVSVSCGIPDFRSRDGIYSRLAVDFPNLPDPQAMFDINYFRQDPRPFFKFAREIYPGQFKPSPCHRFIKMLERHKKLLRNYTQNIDTLEQVAGINNVVECHGSFATASCTVCGHKVTADDIRKDVFHQKIPQCPVCPASSELSRGVMKPDIVFFGEGLPESFHTAMAKDKDLCDLLIVIGSSLKVRPVALIPSSIPSNVPQILINRERLPHLNFDVELYGDSDIIIDEICRMMGGDWTEVCWLDTPLSEAAQLLPPPSRCGYYCEGEEAEMSVDRHEAMDHEMDLPDTADLCRTGAGVGPAKTEGEGMATLIVSTASVCRAPLAAAVFREVARARGAAPPWRTESAGLDPWYEGLPVDPRVTCALRPILSTLDLWQQTTKKTRLVKSHDFQIFDYIFAVDQESLKVLQSVAPGGRKAELILLPAFDPEKADQILHPDHDEEGGFERCLHQCLRSSNGFLEYYTKSNFNFIPWINDS